MPLVIALDAVGSDDLALVGGKAANLGELVRMGAPVPPGFAVTTAAYAQVVEAAGLDAPGAADGGAAMRRAVAAAPVPDALCEEVLGAYAALGGGPVAVRSSATAEDLPGAAFAGQQDTHLGVVGDAAVLDAVRRCWASLWNERAVSYRRRLGIDPAQVRIAVVVQRMVDAEAAGVLLTADPITGDRARMVVEAAPGLGEAVVSGEVTPERYVLDAAGRVLEPTALPSGTVLPEAALRELARWGARVAARAGRPQDVEWAWARGRAWLLQARPMTALPPPPVRLGRLQRRVATVLLDYLTSRPYPIDMSTWVPHGPAALMARVTRHFGLRSLEGFLVEEDGVVTRFVPPAPRPTPGVLLAPWRLVRAARRHDPRRWAQDPRLADFTARVRALGAEDPTAASWPQLLATPRRALALVEPLIALRTDYLPRAGLSLVRLLVVVRLLRRTALTGRLLLGVPTRTEEVNRALEDLAARVREDPGLRAAVAAGDLARLEPFPSFAAALRALLAEHGHRETTSPILVTPPTWGDAPRTVLDLVTALAAGPPAPVRRDAGALEELLRHPLLRTPEHRERVRGWVEEARAGLAFREDTHYHLTRPLPPLRRSLLEIGHRLAAAGVLAERDDVVHLRLEELEGLGDPVSLPEEQRERLRAAVRARAARRAELSGVPLIDPAAVFGRRGRAGGAGGGTALVQGTPASGGVATGPVRVVRGPADFASLAEGEVLVCPYTNPAWTPLFLRAAAVVADTGGLGSHAAIVAREYGVPAVMGTGTGTSVLSDGQVVTVDGRTGRVSAAAPGERA